MNEELFERITGLGPEDEPQPPASRVRRRSPWLVLVVLLLVIWAGYKVESNEAAKHSPPAACQLLGGHWSIWDGWQCY